MRLTQRREEFLRKIIDIFKSTELPVHYGTIAKELGVSKWTAYDILKRLEREGYLRSEYVLNSESKNVGRSMIVFYPTEKALILEGENQSNFVSETEDLTKIREGFMEFFDTMKHVEPKKIIKKLSDELSKTDVPVLFGAYTIALLIVSLQISGIDYMMAQNFLRSGMVAPEIALSFFAGMSLGAIGKGKRDSLKESLMSYVSKFQNHMHNYDGHEKEFLFNLLSDALHR